MDMSHNACSMRSEPPQIVKKPPFSLVLFFVVPAVVNVPSAIAAKGMPAENERVVELPPFAVEENVTTPWRYTELPGVEVLSRCPDEMTNQLIRRQHRLHELLTLLIPRRLQIKRDQPRLYVFYNAENQPGVNRDMVNKIEQQERDAQETGKMKAAPGLHVGFMPNFRFWDEDSLGIFFVVDSVAPDHDDITLSAGYVRYLMESRAPALAPWFVEGMMLIFDQAELSVPPLQTALDIMASASSMTAPRTERDVVNIRPLLRESFGAGASKGKKETRGLAAALPSIETVFNGPADATQIDLWRAQAALFIRWAMDPGRAKPKNGQLPEQTRTDGVPDRTLALWKFVERPGAVDEDWFKECFGLDYAAATEALRNYLPSALADDITLRAAQPVKVPAYTLNDATPLQVSRVRGELARLEIDYVRELFPALLDSYVAQARRILRRAYDLGEQDPRLLASLGLCEVDARDDAAALPFLRAAVLGKVNRPQAYSELARIEWERLIAAHPDRKPTREELTGVLTILGSAREQSPPLPEVYELYARIWIQAELPLSKNIVTLLNSSLGLFPNRVRLIQNIAVLMGMHGRNEEAAALINRGLALTRDPAQRAKLEQLRQSLSDEKP